MRTDLIFIFLALTAMLFVFLFTRISIHHIEGKIKNNHGIPPPEWDSGIGARAPMYALIVLFRISGKNRFIPQAPYVRHYARSIDKVLALALITSISLLTLCLIYSAFTSL